MQAVVITGAAGFIGYHLSENFLSRGYKVFGLDNLSTGMKSNIHDLSRNPHFHFFEMDACSSWKKIEEAVQETSSKVEFVFHFASPASPPLYQVLSIETLHVNSIGLEKALEFATLHKARSIFASTSEVYGDPHIHPQPESYWGYVNSYGERSCYDEAKRYGEALLFSFNKRHQTRHGLVRIFNTYGPRMNPHDGRVVINFLLQAHQGKTLTVYGDGLQTRSFCFIEDLVQGIIAYAQSGQTDPVNLGNPTEFTILELATEIKKMFPEKNLEIEHQILPQDDPKQRRPNIEKALLSLRPWEPKIPLKSGLARTYAWLKDQDLT